MGKTLEYLFAGALALAGLAGGCKPVTVEDNRPNPVKIKVPYESIPKLPLEAELITHINSDPENFDIATAAFMGTGANSWELGEFEKGFKTKLENLKQDSRFKNAKTIPEKTRAIFEALYDFRNYEENTSSVVHTMGRTGNCMGGTVYTEMACQRNGIDLTSVLTEKHIFARLKDNGKDINIETTTFNGWDHKKNLAWEKEIDNRQLISQYLDNLSCHARDQGEKERELAFTIASAKVYPEASNMFRIAHKVRWKYGSDNEVKVFREINSLHQDSEIVRETLARALSFREAQGDIQEAVSLMLPLVQKENQRNEFRYEFMGMLHGKLKNYTEAAKWYRKAVELNPKNKHAKEYLKEVEKNLIRQRVHKQVDRYYEEKK